jgi:hypothetical protein
MPKKILKNRSNKKKWYNSTFENFNYDIFKKKEKILFLANAKITK